MQMGDAIETSSSGEGVVPVAHDGGGEEEGGHHDEKMNNINGSTAGGNRWPRPETLALLKIRSEMDGVFRDSSLKGPLWEEVSRKLAALGYQRSAKKCKEKFENVYKYHKRTKEGRSGKSEGKSYRFFDQLQALENQFTLSYPPKPQPQPQPQPQPTTTFPINTTLAPTLPTPTISYVTTTSTVPSTNPTTLLISPSPSPSPLPPPPTNATTNPINPSQDNNNNNNVSYSLPNMNNLFSTTTTTSTSSSTASDEDLEEKYRKKRKWKDYFRRLTRQVLAKQEEMQKKFLEAIDKREREQVAQQDAWRFQEMSRINREHDLLVQERSSAAAKNAAVIAFLQKLSGSSQQNPPPPQAPPPPPQQQQPPPQVVSLVQQQKVALQLVIPMPFPLQQPNNNVVEVQNINNGHSHSHSAATTPLSSSRWPKPEVHALIKLRTSLEPKYQENGPKAPLWEDISAGMQRLGYNRNAKRCKEKWENINKYYKKMKESNKQRRDDSKTCPYFHELEALYKSKTQNPFVVGSFHNMKSNEMMEMEPLMVQPEQQWRPPPQSEIEESTVVKKNERVEEKEETDIDNDEYDQEEGDSMEEEEEHGCYEVATNKLCSVDTVE